MNTPKTTINFVVIFLNFVILQVSSSPSEDATSSVYGGKPAGFLHIYNGEKTLWNDGQFPYIVEITVYNQHACGGALLKKDIILTAAHCFQDIPICDFRILAGSYKKLDEKSETIQIREVYDVVIHPRYNLQHKGTQPNDIALVFVQKAFDLTPFVQTVTVATKMQRNQFMGTLVVIMGYGEMEEKEMSTKLRLGGVTMLGKRECAESLKNERFINVLCVKCEKEVCTLGTGDSGSPLVKIDKHGKHILLGIASFAFLHSKSQVSGAFKPAVYTDVTEFKDWFKHVKKSIKPKSNRFLNWCKNQ